MCEWVCVSSCMLCHCTISMFNSLTVSFSLTLSRIVSLLSVMCLFQVFATRILLTPATKRISQNCKCFVQVKCFWLHNHSLPFCLVPRVSASHFPLTLVYFMPLCQISSESFNSFNFAIIWNTFFPCYSPFCSTHIWLFNTTDSICISKTLMYQFSRVASHSLLLSVRFVDAHSTHSLLLVAFYFLPFDLFLDVHVRSHKICLFWDGISLRQNARLTMEATCCRSKASKAKNRKKQILTVTITNVKHLCWSAVTRRHYKSSSQQQ